MYLLGFLKPPFLENKSVGTCAGNVASEYHLQHIQVLSKSERLKLFTNSEEDRAILEGISLYENNNLIEVKFLNVENRFGGYIVHAFVVSGQVYGLTIKQ